MKDLLLKPRVSSNAAARPGANRRIVSCLLSGRTDRKTLESKYPAEYPESIHAGGKGWFSKDWKKGGMKLHIVLSTEMCVAERITTTTSIPIGLRDDL